MVHLEAMQEVILFIDNPLFWQHLVALRESAMTQTEIGRKSHMGQSTIAKIEALDIEKIRIGKLVAYAEQLGYDISVRLVPR